MKRTYLRIKRCSKNPGTAKQFGTGDVYHGTRLTGFFFIAEWQFKEDSNLKDVSPIKYNPQIQSDLKSVVIHVFNDRGASMSFYWDKEARHFFNPLAKVQCADINALVDEFIPVYIVD